MPTVRAFAFFMILFLVSLALHAQNGYELSSSESLLGVQSFHTGLKGPGRKAKNYQPAQITGFSESRQNIAIFLAIAGGALIGTAIGQEISGEEAEWMLAGAGLGLSAIAIPFTEAQGFSLSFRAVHGDYKMDAIKSRQRELIDIFSQDIDVPYEITDDFPAHIGYELAFNSTINRWVIGTKVAFRSTGGRFGYSDQTGDISHESLLKMIEVTEFIQYSFVNTEKIRSGLRFNLGMSQTNGDFERSIVLDNGFVEQEKSEGKALNLHLGPGWNGVLFFAKNFYAEVSAGYDFQLSEGIDRDQNGAYGAALYDWEGIRLGAGLGWRFFNE